MTLLDFASGYGGVTRHFRNLIPQGKVVAMDVHDKAMYFNTAHLGVQGVVSDVDPGRVNPFFRFDLVFAIGFFSHLPRHRVGAWLDVLARFVKVGGILLFTAHGSKVHRERFAYLRPDSDGYAFERTSDQDDLALDEYGNAITYPRFMLREVERLSGVELVAFRSAYWWNDHDLYVLRRVA
jgi:cyclopropane fatty-acyl-phospholipid synthase-like methyltransferase